MQPSAWAWDIEALVLVPAMAAAYIVVVRRHATERARITAFALGLALLLAVFVTPLQTLALQYLLSAHLLQNVVLAEWAPALVVFGIPAAFATRVRVPPLLALAAWLATYFVWHVPPIYDFALEHQASVLHVEHATYFAAGVLLWWPVFHQPLGDGAKAAYLFAGFVLASPLGLLLALIPEPVYDFYVDAPRVWGLSPLEDQQIAGLTMAAEQAVVFFALFAFYFLRFMRAEHAVGIKAGTR